MTLYRQKSRLYEATFDANYGAFGTWTLVPCQADGTPLPAVAHQTIAIGPDQFNREWEAVAKHVGSPPPDPVKKIVAWLRDFGWDSESRSYAKGFAARIEAGEWKDQSSGDVK